MKFIPVTKQEAIDIHQRNESDGLDDLHREPEHTHWHSARGLAHFEVIKLLDAEGSWAGLWRVRDRRGNPLPKELQGSFTDVGRAISEIQSHIRSQDKEVI